jgi:hypothetical protein
MKSQIRRKVSAAAILIACAPVLAGCDSATIAADEAKVGQVVAAIKNGATVTTDAILNSINTACGHLGDINTDKAAVVAVISGAARTPGPKTAANLARVDQAVGAAQSICSRSAGGTGNTVANLIILWTHYTTAANAVAAAKQSGGAT